MIGVGSASLRIQLFLRNRAVRVSADGSAESDLHTYQIWLNIIYPNAQFTDLVL